MDVCIQFLIWVFYYLATLPLFLIVRYLSVKKQFVKTNSPVLFTLLDIICRKIGKG